MAKFLIHIHSGPELKNKATLGMLVAITAFNKGNEVNLFLAADGTHLLNIKNEGEVVKTENWGLLNLSYLIRKNKKGSYIHFKIKGKGKVVEELEKNEAIDKKLLRYMTVKVKDFDLNTNYFAKREDGEKTEKKERASN